MKVRTYLSLFNGIGTGSYVLDKMGIEVDKTYVSEIDKYANQTNSKNFPNSENLGDILNWREWDIDWSQVDIITSGTSCQAFSRSGEQRGFRDPRGQILWETLEMIQFVLTKNPNLKWFIENVVMSPKHKEEFDEYVEDYLGEHFNTVLNSLDLNAQSRKRNFWSNFYINDIESKSEMVLRDIVQDDVPEKYIINKSAIPRYLQKNGLPKGYKTLDEKSNCLTASMHKGYGNDGCTVISVIHDGEERYRRLTPIECERLQGFEDGFTEGVSDTQRYKQIGNGWSVPVIEHIFYNMFLEEEN